MGVAAASGLALYIGTTASVALTDTYVAIGSLESISEFGIAFGEIKFEDLTQGKVFDFKGARDDGAMTVGLGKDVSDAGQVAIMAALLVKDDYNFKIGYNDSAAVNIAAATITIASPGVVTLAAHGLLAGTAVSFSTTGALPTGLVAATTYYVKTVLDANTFTLAATAGGTVINTSGTQSGVHTLTTIPTGSFDYFKAKVMGYKTNPGGLTSVIKAAASLSLKSGSLATVVKLP